MPSAAIPRAERSWANLPDLILPVAMVASVVVILAPLPTPLLDVLLAANIAAAVIILLTTIYVRTPLEFSIFPSLLLATTLSRLVLNIATTRLILTRAGSAGLLAAGEVVKSFGEFVAGDKLVVGLVVFSIIVVIQFVVITKGATRISEVAARFALDGMPGRQMAIDADLNAGIIDQQEAQKRRAEVTSQADFFGAMDGASKFVRGDAVAGVIITLVNIAGGLAIGVFENGMDLGQAASIFTRLTIGDGLVSQVPAFLISLAAGLIVTRSSASVNLPAQFIAQLFSRPQVLWVAGAFLGILVFTSLPAIPLVALGGGCVAVALLLGRRQPEAETVKAPAPAAPREQRVEDFLAVDPLEVEIGVGLIRLADPKRGGDLLDRIGRVRQNIATELGVVMPKVRIRDNMRLEQNQYRIKLADVPIAGGKLYPGMLLAIDSGAVNGAIEGQATREPAFDLPAVWIERGNREEVETQGYSIAEPASVLATHVTEIVKRHADEILTRDATKHLIAELAKSSPAVVEDLIPERMKLVEVQQVLQLLLREQVPIRQLALIMETLGEHAPELTEPAALAERVRERLARTLSTRYRDQEHRMYVITLDASLEDRIARSIDDDSDLLSERLSTADCDAICRRIEDELSAPAWSQRPPIILVSPRIRAYFKQITSARLPRLVVLSYREITRDTHLESLAVVEDVFVETRGAIRHSRAA
ncbi:MAG TPA: flagellar biosynthesis protein FlhA [Pirellulales bacterium]|jgi:flagellar biosynthesis protein FlhA|nr:flagellar biosynthesis protein FlhA [Pirellulales bacterium]